MSEYPLVFRVRQESDAAEVEAQLSRLSLAEPADAKLLWIRNTLALAEVECSAAYLAEARKRDD